MLQIIKTEIQRVADFRTEYLNSLPEFQELYLEMMVEESDYYLLTNNQYDLGYFIKTKSKILVEFYLVDEQIPICGCAYDNVGSKKTLEKNGFVSKYKLVEFEIKEKNVTLHQLS